MVANFQSSDDRNQRKQTLSNGRTSTECSAVFCRTDENHKIERENTAQKNYKFGGCMPNHFLLKSSNMMEKIFLGFRNIVQLPQEPPKEERDLL